MALWLYAGKTADSLTKLPSPIELKPTTEVIWSENTGRAQSGANKAKMIGDVVAEKETYAIRWGILKKSEFDTIKNKLKAGFFWFAIGTDSGHATPRSFYRSEIAYDMIQAGVDYYYKDVSVSVIEQ